MGINENRIIGMTIRAGLVILLATGFLWITTWAEDPPVTESFELGDGVEPFAPGTGDIVGASLQNGPDWDDLFDADRGMRDVYDEFGNAGSNGMPDFLDTWGYWKLRRDGGFIVDGVAATDPTVYLEGGAIGAGMVPPAYDVGNAYAFAVFNQKKEFLLYAGLERLSNGPASVVFEFNRGLHKIQDGVVAGTVADGDIRVKADFGASGLISLEVDKWVVADPETGQGDWIVAANLPLEQAEPAEQCNATRSICVVSNAATVDGGAWENYGADGSSVADLAPNTFLEFGLNLSSVIGMHTYDNFYDTRYVSIQVTSYDDAADPAPMDYALGNLARAARMAR